jgi:hypothetical protein
VYRVHRRGFDRVVDAFHPIGRFRCKDSTCDWEGRRSDARDGRAVWQNVVRSPATYFLAFALLGPLIGLGAWYVGSRLPGHGGDDDVMRHQARPALTTIAGAPAERPAEPATTPAQETKLAEAGSDCVWEGPARQPYT